MQTTTHRRGRFGILRHPLIILLIGTGLSSWLIPSIGDRINHRKLFREARLKRATEIINENVETGRNLNRLLTTLEIFQKDSSGPAARFFKLEMEQKELRGIMIDRYLEFDKQAWWWNSQIFLEAKILEIASPEELGRLDQISKQYSENLESSMTAVNAVWNAFLRENYKPDDRRNLDLVNQTRSRLIELNQKRSELVMEEAQIFATK